MIWDFLQSDRAPVFNLYLTYLNPVAVINTAWNFKFGDRPKVKCLTAVTSGLEEQVERDQCCQPHDAACCKEEFNAPFQHDKMNRSINWADAVGGASFEQHGRDGFRFTGADGQYKLSL